VIRSLNNVSIDEIYDAFTDAFSDYEAKMDLTKDQLIKMLVTRSFNPIHSKGYFEKNKLVGFILIGYRKQLGEKIYYDTATGIRQECQKQGIGNTLLEEILKEMKVEEIDRFLLEVLENNIPAQELYKKHGFQITRRLCCFEYELNGIVRTHEYKVVINDMIENDFEDYCSFLPSWQNSNESFINCRDDYTKIDINNMNTKIGYVIINIDNGSIMQFGLSHEYRNIEIVDNILWVLRNEYGINRIRILNIEDKSEMQVLFEKSGMINFINQFEMEYKSNRT